MTVNWRSRVGNVIPLHAPRCTVSLSGHDVTPCFFFFFFHRWSWPRSDHIGWSTKGKQKRRVSLDENSVSFTRYEINVIKEVVAKADEVERKEEKRIR